jgi:streptogramin lyase
MKSYKTNCSLLFGGAFLVAMVVSSGSASGSMQDLFVSYAGTGAVHSISPSGADLGTFGQTAIFSAFDYGLAFDANGNLYAADHTINEILKFSPTGAFEGPFAETGLSNTFSLAFDSSGNLYASNPQLNDVVKFSPSGSYEGIFASSGLSGVRGIAFNSSGDLFVASYSNNAIHEYSPTGVDLGVFATTTDPVNLAFDSAGNLYVTNNSQNTISEFAPNGTDLGVFVSAGLNEPAGIAFNSSGDLFVANIATNSILEFAPSGASLGTFFNAPAGSLPDTLVFGPAIAPEPGSAALLSIGGLLLIARYFRWRRRA